MISKLVYSVCTYVCIEYTYVNIYIMTDCNSYVRMYKLHTSRHMLVYQTVVRKL